MQARKSILSPADTSAVVAAAVSAIVCLRKGAIFAIFLGALAMYGAGTAGAVPTRTPTPTATPVNGKLGLASAFNLFVLEDAKLSSSDIEGRAAVGGKASASNYSVGRGLGGLTDAFIVGKDLDYDTGTSFGNIIVRLQALLKESVSILNGDLLSGSPVDFNLATSQLQGRSSQLAGVAANGIADRRSTDLMLRGVDTITNVFNVDWVSLNPIPEDPSRTIRTIRIDVPPSSTAVLNVRGESIDFKDLRILSPSPEKVLLNFPEAKSLKVSQSQIAASLLAPFAKVKFDAGLVIGQMVAKEFDGFGEFHKVDFDGQLDALPQPVTPTPTATPVTGKLGAASGFNLFVLDDAKLRASDIEGRAAVGGRATASNYSVGRTSGGPSGPDSFIVGKDLDYDTGTTVGNVVVGLQAQLRESVNIVGGELRAGTPVDFNQARSQLEARSTQLGGILANGVNRKKFTDLELRGTDPLINVFDVCLVCLNPQPDDPSRTIRTISLNVPAAATAVINFRGDSVDLDQVKVLSPSPNKVMLNFPEAKKLSVKQTQIAASVLAPFSKVQFDAGLVVGQMVAKEFDGFGEFHRVDFDGDLDAVP